MHGILQPAKLQNFDTWQRDRFADYGGSDRKDGLIDPDGALYLIKYAENHTRKNELDTSYVNNVLSEYLSSHILSIIGYDVHETVLGTRRKVSTRSRNGLRSVLSRQGSFTEFDAIHADGFPFRCSKFKSLASASFATAAYKKIFDYR